MSVVAFDLAERFQTPVLVLSDLDIGMNDWMVPKLTWDDSYQPDRGKVLSAEELAETTNYYRYFDTDGDFIPARTLPGVHPKGAYFTRGSGHNKFGAYTEDSEEYQEVLDRIARKINSAAEAVPEPFTRTSTGASTGLITVGGCHSACIEALDHLEKEGLHIDYLRVRGFPFGNEVNTFVDEHDIIFVVEQNRDGQLRSLLLLETGVSPSKLSSICYYAGYPLSAHHVVQGIHSMLGVTV